MTCSESGPIFKTFKLCRKPTCGLLKRILLTEQNEFARANRFGINHVMKKYGISLNEDVDLF